jgi:hypothetical protein
MRQPTAVEMIEDHLDKLIRILADIEQYHGTMQDFSAHIYVRGPYQQARYHIDQIRLILKEQQNEQGESSERDD